MPKKLELQILRTDGKIEKRIKCHSWLLQEMQLLEATQKGVHTDTIKDITGAARTFVATNYTFPSWAFRNAPAGNITYGIVLGSGTNGMIPSDVALQTPILHGGTSGKLSYGACVNTEAVVSGNNIINAWARTITNGSGADITVNEVAIYEYWQFNTTNYSFAVVRDVISPYTFANTTVCTFQYVETEINH